MSVIHRKLENLRQRRVEDRRKHRDVFFSSGSSVSKTRKGKSYNRACDSIRVKNTEGCGGTETDR